MTRGVFFCHPWGDNAVGIWCKVVILNAETLTVNFKIGPCENPGVVHAVIRQRLKIFMIIESQVDHCSVVFAR